jgi:zinc and cadmium transporter
MAKTTAILSLYCLTILLASMAGGWVPLVRRLTHIQLQTYLSFAAGVMLGAGLCHMLPEAAGLGESWFQWTLAGLLGVFFLERFFAFHRHAAPEGEHGHHPIPTHPAVRHVDPPHEHEHEHRHERDETTLAHQDEYGRSRLAWGPAFVGLSVHTLTGGFALASAVAADAEKPGLLGLSVFLATLLHKPADSLTITSLMVSAGARRRTTHVVNFLFALVIPLGVVLYFLMGGVLDVSEAAGFRGGALAFSAGTFLSIALGDLMPELQFHTHDRVKLSAALLAGVAVMYVSAMLGG